MILIRLFFEFFKTGLFAIGGGLATIPFLYDMMDSTGWFTAEDLAAIIAISEATPGSLGVNMATYVGFITAGTPGAVIAPLGLVTPSVIIILAIARALERFRENRYVQYALYGLRAASIALIANAGAQVFKISLLDLGAWQDTGIWWRVFDFKAILLAVIVFFAMRKLKWHPVAFLGICALAGVIFGFGG